MHHSGAAQREDDVDDDDGEDLGEASYLSHYFVADSALSRYCPCRLGLAQSFLPLSLPSIAVYRWMPSPANVHNSSRCR